MINYRLYLTFLSFLIALFYFGVNSTGYLYFSDSNSIDVLKKFLIFGTSLNAGKLHYIGYHIVFITLIYLKISQHRKNYIIVRSNKLKSSLSDLKAICLVTISFVTIICVVYFIQFMLIFDISWLLKSNTILYLLPLFILLSSFYLISGVIFKLVYDMTNSYLIGLTITTSFFTMIYGVRFFAGMNTILMKIGTVFNNLIIHEVPFLVNEEVILLLLQYLAISGIIFIFNLLLNKRGDVKY